MYPTNSAQPPCDTDVYHFDVRDYKAGGYHYGHSNASENSNNSDQSNINLSNIKVTVGIDEDLRMILEMDPSIVDLGADIIGCNPTSIARSHSNESKSLGLPPISGGYVSFYI